MVLQRNSERGYGRVSKFSKTKEDALQCLADNGYHPQLIEMLRETGHVPSLIATSQGMYSCGIALDKCLRNAERQRGGRHGEMMDRLQAWIDGEIPAETEAALPIPNEEE